MKFTALIFLAAMLYQPEEGQELDRKKLFGEVDAALTLGWGLDCHRITGDKTYKDDAPRIALAHLKAAGFDDEFIQRFWGKYIPKFQAGEFRKKDVKAEGCVKYFTYMRNLHPGYNELDLPE